MLVFSIVCSALMIKHGFKLFFMLKLFCYLDVKQFQSPMRPEPSLKHQTTSAHLYDINKDLVVGFERQIAQGMFNRFSQLLDLICWGYLYFLRSALTHMFNSSYFTVVCQQFCYITSSIHFFFFFFFYPFMVI